MAEVPQFSLCPVFSAERRVAPADGVIPHHVRAPICFVPKMPNISRLIFTITVGFAVKGNSVSDMLNQRYIL